MRIEKWGFLLSYVIYLIFCIGLSVINKDTATINTMIFAITIASTFFSISDILFTKCDVDKKERESLQGLYNLSNYARKFYINKIEIEYSKQAEEMLSILMDLFRGNEDKIEKFFTGELPAKEQMDFVDSVKAYSNAELTEFVSKNMSSDTSDIKEIINEDETEDIKMYKVFDKQKKKEQIYYAVASFIVIMGLSALLIILTLRIDVIPHISNIFTVVAFLSVIINLFLKEYYKVNSLKKIEQERREMLNDLRKHTKN